MPTVLIVILVLVIATFVVFRVVQTRQDGDALPDADDNEREPDEDTIAARERHYSAQRRVQLAAIARKNGWTGAAYDQVLNGHIGEGMNQDMVLLAWGGPTSIDNRLTTPAGARVERWIYRSPQDDAVQYVWFADGRVVRIEV